MEWVIKFETPYWWDDAECANDEYAHKMLFSYSEKTQKEAVRLYCDPCPVRKACLTAALQVPVSWDYGVWGGLTSDERREYRKQQSDE